MNRLERQTPSSYQHRVQPVERVTFREMVDAHDNAGTFERHRQQIRLGNAVTKE